MKDFKKKLIKRVKSISSIDIIGLLIIIFITATVYFLLNRKTEYLNVTVRLLNQEMPEYEINTNMPKSWYIEKIKVGTTQKGSLGEKLIEIADVYTYPNGYIYNTVYVTLKIKVSQNRTTKQYVYEGSPLLVHDVRSFKIQDILISGEIVDISQKNPDLKSFKVTFELQPEHTDSSVRNNSQALISGVENYIAGALNENMFIADNKNNKIVEITKITKQPGDITYVAQDGIHKDLYPDRTKVTLETNVLAEKVNNFYYYRKEEPIIVDRIIYLTFDKVTVIGKIVKIEEN